MDKVARGSLLPFSFPDDQLYTRELSALPREMFPVECTSSRGAMSKSDMQNRNGGRLCPRKNQEVVVRLKVVRI